jgi:GT2 family glycosyltransferase
MENNKTIDVSVILPLNSSKHKDFDEYLSKCIQSLEFQTVKPKELVIVHSGEQRLKEIIESLDYSGLSVNIVENTGDFDYASQVNLGVENSKCDWVSFLEFDDEYSSIWFKNVNEYIDSHSDVDAFLPLVVDTDEKGMFVGFTNEAAFAVSMNADIGYLTNELLLSYQNFQSSGMVIKKNNFKECGGFKKSFKLTFVYEFLLRLTYNSVKIMTIPRIGYKHMNLREGSIFWNYKFGEKKISDDEVSFWIDSAKKEHFFSIDRNIKFDPISI